MNALRTPLDSGVLQAEWVERVGWILLHSLWQIALMAAIYAFTMGLLQRTAANARYVVGCVTLAALLVVPMCTYVVLSWDAKPAAMAGLTEQPVASRTTRNDPPDPSARSFGRVTAPMQPATQESLAPSDRGEVPGIFPSPPRSYLRWAAVAWLAGVLLFSLRPAWGWLHIRRLGRYGLTPVSEAVERTGALLTKRLGVKRAVRFAQSALVEVPTVIGYLRPLILLPASAVSGLSPQQLELILAHELAHVRRSDYIVNAVQLVVETVLFYHPAVWWVSSRVREERENCCDDLVLLNSGNRAAYARALLCLEERRSSTRLLELSSRGGSLTARIRRILGEPSRTVPSQGNGKLLSVFILLLLLGSSASLVARNRDLLYAAEDPGSVPVEAGIRSLVGFNRATVQDGRVAVKGKVDKDKVDTPHDLVLQIDKDGQPLQWRNLGIRGEFNVVVEGSDKLTLEGGKTGHGIVMTTSLNNRQSIIYIALTSEDPISGTFAIRPEAAFTRTDGVLTFADITLADGKKVSVSLRLEPSTGPGGAEPVVPEQVAASNAEPMIDTAPKGPTATLSGRFIYDGDPPAAGLLRITPYRAMLDGTRFLDPMWEHWSKVDIPDERLIVGKERGIANVVVWVRSKDIPKPAVSDQRLPPVTVRVKDGRFQPHVLAFWNAAPIKWVNEMLPYNVNVQWNPLRGTPHNPLLSADQPEIEFQAEAQPVPVPVTSNIQPWLRSYILPLDHPYSAVTGRNGRFTIADLPVGTWEFRFWHERRGWLQTDRFPTGRFNLKIRPGENSLGDLQVAPDALGHKWPPPSADFFPPDPYSELGIVRNAGPGWHFLRVASHQQAALDLGISLEQKEAIRLLFDAYLAKDRELEARLRREHGSLPVQQWEQERSQQWLKARELASRLLSKSQIRDVEQMMVRREGFHALLRKDIQERLQLSDRQLPEITTAIQRHVRGGGRDSLRRLGTEISGVLSSEQRARFDELRGLAQVDPPSTYAVEE